MNGAVPWQCPGFPVCGRPAQAHTCRLAAGRQHPEHRPVVVAKSTSASSSLRRATRASSLGGAFAPSPSSSLTSSLTSCSSFAAACSSVACCCAMLPSCSCAGCAAAASAATAAGSAFTSGAGLSGPSSVAAGASEAGCAAPAGPSPPGLPEAVASCTVGPSPSSAICCCSAGSFCSVTATGASAPSSPMLPCSRGVSLWKSASDRDLSFVAAFKRLHCRYATVHAALVPPGPSPMRILLVLCCLQ